jgi:hypothetical protein
VIALRTLVRHAVPLVLLSLVAFVPLWLVVRGMKPATAGEVKTVVRLVWILAGTAWMFQLALVGAAAPLVGQRLSQLAGARAAVLGFRRAIVPCAAAAIAVLIGGVALVVPGLILLVLFALTGASAEPGLPAPLLDSAAIVRRARLPVVALVAGLLVVDVALAFIALRFPFAIGKKPNAAQLASYRHLLPNLVVALALVTPPFACALAAIHRNHKS